MSKSITIEIPELFSDGCCFHDAVKQCPFAWREPLYDEEFSDIVRCNLGLNNADEIDKYTAAQLKYIEGEITEDEMPPYVGVFSIPGIGCPGPGIYELTRKEKK